MADFAQLGIELRSIGVDKVNRDIRSVTDNAKSTERSVQSLLGVMGKLKVLMTAGLGIQGLGQFIQMSDKMKTLAAQVKFVTNSFEEYKAVQSQLFSISQRTRADLEATTTIYARSARALKDYGYSQERILTFTETLNKAMAVGGVGAQEQASALFQLSQALGSGRLQGDEFRTIAETAPIILDVVAQYMGKTRSEVKQLASEGKITSQLLFEAITGATEKISADFEKMPLTFGQAMTQLKNQTLKFVDDVGNRSGIFDGMAASVSFLAKNIDYLSVVIGSVLLGQLGKASVAGIKSVLTKRQEAVAALEVAQATSVQATAELRLAQIQMQSLRAQLSLAQSEQTRMALRGQMATQASQLTVLMNAEREATERAALAKQKLSLAGRASGGVLSLLGGPIGLVTTALTLGAGAFYTWKQNAEQAKQENLDYAKSLDVTSDALQKLTANQLEAMSAKLKRSMAEQKNQIQSLIEEKSRMERALSIQTRSMDEGNLWQNQYALKRYNQLLEDLKIKKGEIDSANQQLAKSERDLKSIGAEESVQRLKESVEKLYPELQFNKDKFVELKLSTEDFKDLLPDANGKILGMADALAQAAQKARLLLSGVIGVKEETAGIGADAQKVIDDLRLDRKIANAKTPQERAAGETEKYIKRLSEQGKYSKPELDAIEKEYQANALARENRSSGAKGSGNKVDYVKQYTDQVTQLQQRLADIKANLQDGGISQYQELKKLTNDIAANGEKYAHFGAEGLANLKRLASEIDSGQQQVAIRDLGDNYKEQIEARQFELTLIGQTSEAVDQLRFNHQLELETAKLRKGMTQENIALLEQTIDEIKRLKEEQAKQTASLKSDPAAGFRDGFQKFQNTAEDVMGNVSQITLNAFNGMSDAVTDFILTGKGNFRGFAQSVIKDITSMIVKMMIFASLKAAFEGTSIGKFFGFSGGGSVPESKYTGGLVGFDEGGFTGQGGKYTPAGIVHKGEYVFTKEAVSRLGVNYLDQLNYQRKAKPQGYANGGSVGGYAPSTPMNANNRGVKVNIINNGEPTNANVETKETSGGLEITVELVQDIARKEAGTIMQQNMRPGGMFA